MYSNCFDHYGIFQFYALYKRIEISPNAIATMQLPDGLETVQSVTGRVKKSSVAPASSTIQSKKSIGSQTGDIPDPGLLLTRRSIAAQTGQ